jgi:hypothetical protein
LIGPASTASNRQTRGELAGSDFIFGWSEGPVTAWLTSAGDGGATATIRTDCRSRATGKIGPKSSVGHGLAGRGIGLVRNPENDQDAALIGRFRLREVNGLVFQSTAPECFQFSDAGRNRSHQLSFAQVLRRCAPLLGGGSSPGMPTARVGWV